MDRSPHGCIHAVGEVKEPGSQMNSNPQESSDCAKTTLTDSERTLTASFGEIKKIDHDGESEVDSASVFSQGKHEIPANGCARTLASNIGNIKKTDFGDESEAYVSADVAAFGKQEVCSDDKDIDLRVTTPVNIIPENEERVITESLKESAANNQSAKKVTKRSREDKGGHKIQKSTNPNLQGSGIGIGQYKRGKANERGAHQSQIIRGSRAPISNLPHGFV